MEILGIGPGEFLLILVVLLVAVGPERLPTLARQAGQLLVRGRAWLQSSPDAALILRARQEIEQELATLRSSLLEVQSVRDEVLGAVKQAESAADILTSARIDLNDIGSIAPPAPSAASLGSASAGASADPSGPEPTLETSGAADLPRTSPAQAPVQLDKPIAPKLARDPGSVARQPTPPASERRENGVPPTMPPGAAEALAAFESIELRLQAIMADLFALQQELKQRGALADDWRPPSWDMRLPDPADKHMAEPIETGETG